MGKLRKIIDEWKNGSCANCMPLMTVLLVVVTQVTNKIQIKCQMWMMTNKMIIMTKYCLVIT